MWDSPSPADQPKMMVRSAQTGRGEPWLLVGVAAALTAAYLVFRLTTPSEVWNDLFDGWVYNSVIVLAALACFWQALGAGRLRGACIAFGLGLAAWAAGSIYWSLAIGMVDDPPYPSLADAGYLAALPALYTGIALLVRERTGRFTVAQWLDGAVVGLTAVAFVIAFLAPVLVGYTDGDVAVVVTNLAYPAGDVFLVLFIVGALSMTGLERSKPLLAVGAGLIIWTAADISHLYSQATGTLGPIWADVGWLLGAVLIAAGTAFANASVNWRSVRPHTSFFVPAIAATGAVTLLVWDHFDRVHPVAVVVAGLTLLLTAARLVIGTRENTRLMEILQRDAQTDPLTGLANRRALMEDLEARLRPRPGRSRRSYLFALFDLDGFKTYNDTFGHPAGDALLARVGHRLRETISEGAAYRLGGDEFCMLVPLPGIPGQAIQVAREALVERGEGFAIDASFGAVELPREASNVSDVLRLADRRMYLAKGKDGNRAENQTYEVLARILREREPQLGEHVTGVAAHAVALARALGMEAEDVDVVGRAAQLHDVGKIAIPDAILFKPGPLDEDEWRLMRRHTLIGERILSAAPALAPVAKLVRWSHERWDGRGYPDGIAGEQIPLGARIIFVCDAFDAMTADRPYCPPMSETDALAELRRNAGTQFDRHVAETFCGLVESGEWWDADGPHSRPERTQVSPERAGGEVDRHRHARNGASGARASAPRLR